MHGSGEPDTSPHHKPESKAERPVQVSLCPGEGNAGEDAGSLQPFLFQILLLPQEMPSPTLPRTLNTPQEKIATLPLQGRKSLEPTPT